MNNDSLNFRNHFIAQFSFPKNALNDFTVWTNIPWADVGVHIYIPGQENIIKFDICTNNALRKYVPNKHNHSCLFYLESAASSIPSVTDYYKSDEDYLKKLVNSKDKDIFTLDCGLCSPIEFLTLVEDKLTTLLHSTFNDKFSITDENSKPLATTLSPEYVEKSVATFKRAFNKCRRILDPKVNPKYEQLLYTPGLIGKINDIVNFKLLRKLNFDLQKNLVKNEVKSKTIKI